ncbi:MAG: hypothetical protein JNM20_04800 [Rhizobiales bacterium]|nr:hypothetical protein [Hyphomicrobiales bacterium]
MSKLMIVLGILAVAIGVAVGVLGYMSPGQMQVAGLTAEVAAIFLVGGILAVGLGGAIDAVNEQRKLFRDLAETLVARTDRAAERLARATHLQTAPEPSPPKQAVPPPIPEAETPPAPAPDLEPAPAPEQKPLVFAGSVRSLEQARERAGLKPVDQPAAETRITTRETIIAIEKAKSDLETALGPPPGAPAAAEPPAERETVLVAEVETEFDAAPAEGEEEQLYVMEEKLIRGRPARVLSDGTVEAETDEGWMRFENLEHLEEYLDAMSPAKG